MNRTAGSVLVSLLAGLVLVGCVESHTEGDRLVVTNHWSATLIPGSIGVAMIVLGVPLITGRLQPKGKPRVLGALLLFFGVLFSIGSTATVPFERVTIDRQELSIQQGVFGYGSRKHVDLANVQSLRLYKKSIRSHGSGRKRRRGWRNITVAEFTSHQGEMETVKIGGEMRSLALEHLLGLAPELGIEIIDDRNE